MSILTLEVVAPFTLKEHGQVSVWQPGQRLHLPPDKAQRIMDRVGDRVRIIERNLMDEAIGTVVQAWQEFVRGDGERILGTGPWIVADVVIGHQPGLLAGRWLLLVHGSSWRWSHETKTAVYHCPTCKGSRCWWSEHTVLCIHCISPSVPQWRELWREIATLSAGIVAGHPHYVDTLDALHMCDEGFRLGDYAAFQVGLMRLRRASQGTHSENSYIVSSSSK